MERLNQIFREVFDDDRIVITEKTKMSDIEAWDSLEHVNLIMAIEQEFGMEFDMEDAMSVKSIKDIISLINV